VFRTVLDGLRLPARRGLLVLGLLGLAQFTMACGASTPPPAAPPARHAWRSPPAAQPRGPEHKAPPPAYGNKIVQPLAPSRTTGIAGRPLSHL
jgi:hypothetical protein